jgi:hypothetical protein
MELGAQFALPELEGLTYDWDSFRKSSQTFRRNLLSPFSGQNSGTLSEQ